LSPEYGANDFAVRSPAITLEAAVYLLLVPPIAVAITLLVIGVRRVVIDRPAHGNELDAHRRALEALDPRAPARKAAQQAAQESPKSTARVSRHA
jgi:hypothetical protein